MHYDDPEQLAKAELVIVVYKHHISGTRHHEVALSSIQSCRYLEPHIVQELISEPHKHLRKLLLDKPEEAWLELTIKPTKTKPYWKLHSCVDVSRSKNQFKYLH